ncbi:hypothetical protein GC089_07790 [Cellulomonas sp. JZ18]|uniref:NosD domain-containing protein n=1 Tax=Cellulomonas sp. JZ18 TaxID=2654191 RepID=UPI0012D3C847|nr:right-handed parallel beta-helix repeat-containing protein [Cellulomonas sp. JZ18]QGQ19149.1 hypothetical protein GC089_07790 [Cellulomonas sp. JZ18]
MRTGTRTGLSVLAVAALTALGAAPASAAPPPACGDTLTVDTVLTADLSCPAGGPGLRLAPGVTLDLGGHVLRGPGPVLGSGRGVEVTREGEAVVRNGTVAGWSTGVGSLPVETGGPTGVLTLERLVVRDNGLGADVSGEPGSGFFAKPLRVVRSTFLRNGDGVLTPDSDAVIERSTFAEHSRAGVVTDDGGGATITGSRFLRNRHGVFLLVQGSADVVGSEFVDNTIGVGAEIAEAYISVRDSRFTGSQIAVDAEWAQLSLSGSRLVANTTGVVLGDWGASIVGNRFRANETGIRGSGPGLIQDNVLRWNGDGIVIDPAYDTLALGGNDVRRSSGWGIHAPGVTDLGGNVARGNGNEPQCVGVVCGGRPPS